MLENNFLSVSALKTGVCVSESRSGDKLSPGLRLLSSLSVDQVWVAMFMGRTEAESLNHLFTSASSLRNTFQLNCNISRHFSELRSHKLSTDQTRM